MRGILKRTQVETDWEIANTGFTGVCERYQWKFLCNGRSVTKAIRRMERSGFIELNYLGNGGVSVLWTDAGEAYKHAMKNVMGDA